VQLVQLELLAKREAREQRGIRAQLGLLVQLVAPARLVQLDPPAQLVQLVLKVYLV
jgi:hypothetical protein